MKKRKPRNLVEEDRLMWVPQAGQLWGDYKTCAKYRGISPSSFAAYVWRHHIKTITYGRRKIVRKTDLDRLSGAMVAASQQAAAPLPLRRRRRTG